MKVFNHYARYYDLLYRDKDYVGETQFIHKLLQTHAPDANKLLDLGCGTGIHAGLLAEKGYQVHGVDFSLEMLQRGNDRLSTLPQAVADRLEFTHGDIRQIDLNQSFDAILSLFHVISYQNSNEDLLAAFTTAQQHLKSGGIFIFDAWYGPGVLTHPPSVRVKRLEDDSIQVTRIAEPVMHLDENVVDVNYQMFIRDKQSHEIQDIQESHHMRYLFLPEVRFFLSECNFNLIDYGEWLTDQKPEASTWGVFFVARKK
jgi:SAM-dependent methyltransferase